MIKKREMRSRVFSRTEASSEIYARRADSNCVSPLKCFGQPTVRHWSAGGSKKAIHSTNDFIFNADAKSLAQALSECCHHMACQAVGHSRQRLPILNV